MPIKQVKIFVPGILNWPNSSKNWEDKATTWTNIQDKHYPDSVHYFCTPIMRAFHQQKRILRVKNLLETYVDNGDFKISLIGHSNGCDLVVNALKETQDFRVESVHLLSGACEANFELNSLNKALLEDKIGKVYVYVAGADKAMILANSWIGRFCEYGHLGLNGPTNVDQRIAKRVITINEKSFGHSEWWNDDNFDNTMRLISK